jgi:predicted TIM-barrel fold metal-dependent hydrolase
VALHRLMDRYRRIRWVLVMGPPVAAFGMSGAWEFPEEVLAAYRHDHMLVEVMFPITWGDKWDYPYPEAQRLIEDLRNKLGADRLVWGSDMPNVERFCTYRQSIDYVRRYCPFLSSAEKDLILGGTMDTLFGLSARRVRA